MAWLPYQARLAYCRQIIGIDYPRFLYRYVPFDSSRACSVSFLRDTVVNSLLWLSSPRDFNDPFDMRANLKFDASIDQRRARVASNFLPHLQHVPEAERARKLEEVAMSPDILEASIRKSFESNIARVGVCCFTPHHLNVLMWSHYAAKHAGIVLQFDPFFDIFRLMSAVSVKYTEQYPAFDWFNESDTGLSRVMRYKHPAWKYEQEWRIVRPGDANTLCSFAPRALRGIILGCSSTRDSEDSVRTLLAERKGAGLPSVALFAADRHEHDYRLVLRRLEV